MKRKIICLIAAMLFLQAAIFAEQEDTSVEIGISVNWTFGCYKESTFSSISQGFLAPRFQLDTVINSKSFIHKITMDYFFARPQSAMTKTSVVYKNYDPVSGETYYEGFESNLMFHKICVRYDLNYRIASNEKMDFAVGGSFSTDAYLQFSHYPSITGLFSLGPSCSFDYRFDDKNSLSVSGGIPLVGFGVRPPFAGCDAQLMKYAEENFMKIFTLGKFLSLHNYQSIFVDCDYKVQAGRLFTLGVGLGFEYSRIAVPKEKPLYYLDGSFKTFGRITF